MPAAVVSAPLSMRTPPPVLLELVLPELALLELVLPELALLELASLPLAALDAAVVGLALGFADEVVSVVVFFADAVAF